jgi:hypothetical protein
MGTMSVYVTLPPAGMLSVLLMAPEPDGLPQVAPPAPAQLQVPEAANWTCVPGEGLGPALLAVIV